MRNIIANVNKKQNKEAALMYAAHGLKVFPLVVNGKKPATTNGFKDASADISVINGIWEKSPKANLGFPTGQTSGVFVLDIDVKNGKLGEESLAELVRKHGQLPETLEQKTPSGGRHLFFKSPTGVRVATRTERAPGIDVRGDGGYVVVAPSSVDGVKYQFTNPGVEVAEAPEWLIAWINDKKAVSASLAGKDGLVREGGRNTYLFELCMDCNRDGLPIEKARELVLEANSERCLPPLSQEEVETSLASAFRYRADQDIPKEIIEMNRKHAVVWVNDKCRVLKEGIDHVFGTKDVKFVSFQDIRECYSNRYVEIDGKTRPLGEAWIKSIFRREYEGVGFYPKGAPKGHYNLWNGFAVEPKEGDCSLYLNHIRENIANGNERIFNYIIAWMADVVQNPDRLVGTALVLRGSMGVGKGVFANWFGSLFGRHYIVLNNSGLLVGRFNGHFKDKVLLLADEAFWGGDKQSEGPLKNLVTEPIITIEEKGLNAYPVKNHLHMIFSTNNEWAVPAGPQERRFFVVDVGEKRMQDSAYFGAITKQMENGGKEALLYLLQDYDLTGIDLRKYPQTQALWEQKVKSFTPVQKFWFHKLSTGQLDEEIREDDRYIPEGWGEGEIQTKRLYEIYQHFLKELGVKHKPSSEELGIELHKLLPEKELKKIRRKVGSSRPYYYKFASLEECREQFARLMNYDIDWNDCEEEVE